MNKKEFIKAWKNGTISTLNRQIERITLTGSGHWRSLEALVEFTDDKYYPKEFRIPVERLYQLLFVFTHDKFPDVENRWQLNEFDGKYVRACYYNTPEEEMHELADEKEFVGLKHITRDDPDCCWTYIHDNSIK